MDKYEYRVRADQIKELLANHQYSEAMEVCNTIDWKRVKSISMLCTVSEIYKINKRYEDARDILLMAYDRSPNGKTIVYALCELSIKLGETVQALEFYKEFCMIAPRDLGQYILKYKLDEALEVSLDERIELLKEYKSREYRERWAYELAYLYHCTGQETKCVEECDELILWFGEGKFVLKAMELKMLHKPLSDSQKEKYNHMMGIEEDEEFFDETHETAEPEYVEELDNNTSDNVDSPIEGEASQTEESLKQPTQEIPVMDEDGIIPTTDEDAIQVKTVNVDKYSTINLQAELSRSMQEVLENENESVGLKLQPVDEEADVVNEKEVAKEEKEPYPEKEYHYPEDSENDENSEEKTADSIEEESSIGKGTEVSRDSEISADSRESSNVDRYHKEEQSSNDEAKGKETHEPVETSSTQVKKSEKVSEAAMDRILSQEYDGQISMVVPEQEIIEKQITGQMDISGYLEEWERQLKENQAKRIAKARLKSLEETNDILSQLEGIMPGVTGPVPTVEDIVKDIDIPPTHIPAEVAPEVFSNIPRNIQEEPGVEEIPEIEEDYYDDNPEDIADENYQTQEAYQEDIQEEISEEYPEEISEEYQEEYPEEISEEYPEDIQEEISEEYQEEYPEDIPEEISEEYPEDIQVAASEKYEEEVEEELEDDIPEMTADEAEDDAFENEEIPPSADDGSLPLEDADLEDLFGSFLSMKNMPSRIRETVAHSRMQGIIGNILIFGNEKSVRLKLALALAKAKQRTDINFTGKIAKITGQTLNTKDVKKAISKLEGGALIIEGAGALTITTLDTIATSVNHPDCHILIILEDERVELKRLTKLRPYFEKMYDVRLKVPVYSNDDLVSHAKEYALEREYTIDDMGILALYTRIDELQTSSHFVTITEVEQIMDEAIDNVDKKNFAHLKDILFAKRYDKDDLIIIRERDFVKKRG